MAGKNHEYWADLAKPYLERGFTFERAAYQVLYHERQTGLARRSFSMHIAEIVKILKERDLKACNKKLKRVIR